MHDDLSKSLDDAIAQIRKRQLISIMHGMNTCEYCNPDTSDMFDYLTHT